MKICNQCKEEKLLTAFERAGRNNQYFRNTCRSCRDRIRDKTKLLAKKKRWYNKNRTVIREKQRISYANSLEKQVLAKNRSKIWRFENYKRWLILHRSIEANRRARKMNQFIENINHKTVFIRDEGICGICENPVDENNWHLDHIIPLCKGGLHSYTNVQVAHPSCNFVKGGGE